MITKSVVISTVVAAARGVTSTHTIREESSLPEYASNSKLNAGAVGWKIVSKIMFLSMKEICREGRRERMHA